MFLFYFKKDLFEILFLLNIQAKYSRITWNEGQTPRSEVIIIVIIIIIIIINIIYVLYATQWHTF